MDSVAKIKRSLLGEKYKVEIRFESELASGKFSKEGDVVDVNEESDSITGAVILVLGNNVVTEHLGVKVEWFGQIEILGDKKILKTFSYLSNDIAAPGEIRNGSQIKFVFQKLDKRYESYYGTNLTIRYVIKACVKMSNGNNYATRDVIVRCRSTPSKEVVPIKRELRIEDVMFIGFDCSKNQYHLNDVIIGKIFFKTVCVMIKQVEISIARIEKFGVEKRSQEMEILKRYEVMYGSPNAGTVVPIRLQLKYTPLTPTYTDINTTFSVTYYMLITLIDEQDRRYSRKQEIQLYRKSVTEKSLSDE